MAQETSWKKGQKAQGQSTSCSLKHYRLDMEATSMKSPHYDSLTRKMCMMTSQLTYECGWGKFHSDPSQEEGHGYQWVLRKGE